MRKLSLFTNNIIIYVEIPNESQKNPLLLLKHQCHKIQKSILFLCTSTKKIKNKLQEMSQ
jgi:hypothetical protein